MTTKTFTLDDIRAAAEAKYGSTPIALSDGSICELVNPLRLPKKKRDALVGLQDELEADGADQEALLAKAIRLAAKSGSKADALIEEIDGDLAVLVEVFNTYNESTQMGEASASDD